MSEVATIARPYARAAFEHAQAAGSFQEWSDLLKLLSAVVQDPGMQDLLGSPAVDLDAKGQLVVDICGDRLQQDGINFVHMLAANRRLSAAPDIAALYEIFRADAERTVKAEVVSARKLTKEQQQKLTSVLSKRLGREVVLNCRVDASLLGGAIVRAGDMVIDGSAQGKLEQLASAMIQ